MVGGAAGQIARIEGCRTVGAEKCRHVVADLGFDAAIDYKVGPIEPERRRTASMCISTMSAATSSMTCCRAPTPIRARRFCGRISQYHSRERRGLANVGVILDKCVTARGFRIGDHLARRDQALDELMAWFRVGRLRFRETSRRGFRRGPAALVNMLSGGNTGKQVARLAAAAA